MGKITGLFLTVVFVSAIPALAQSNEKNVTDVGVAQSDLTDEMQVLRKALQDAKTPADKFDANLNIADLRFKQKIYGEAVYYAGEALKIADSEFPNDAARRSIAVVRKAKALRKVGRTDEASTLINDDVDRKSKQGDHIWRAVDGGIRHRFSGMNCPDFVAQMPRKEFHNFSQAGVDVGCSYELISKHTNLVTVYLTRYGGRVQDLDAIKGGGAALLKRLPDSQKIAVEQLANFKSGHGNPVYYTLVSFGSVHEGEKYTGAWTQVIGGWVLKTRVTWAAELGVNFGAEKTKALFTQNTDKIIDTFKVCEKLATPKTGTRLNGGAGSMAIILGALTNSLADELVGKNQGAASKKTLDENAAEAPLITMPQEPNITCFAAKSSGDEIALGYHPGESRRYSSYSAVVDQNFFVELDTLSGMLSKSKKPQFLLKTLGHDTVSIFQIYDGEPSPEIVFKDIIDAINGEISALGSATREDDKNVTIYVNPDLPSEVENE